MKPPVMLTIDKVEGVVATASQPPRVSFTLTGADGGLVVLDMPAREAALLRDYANRALESLQGR